MLLPFLSAPWPPRAVGKKPCRRCGRADPHGNNGAVCHRSGDGYSDANPSPDGEHYLLLARADADAELDGVPDEALHSRRATAWRTAGKPIAGMTASRFIDYGGGTIGYYSYWELVVENLTTTQTPVTSPFLVNQAFTNNILPGGGSVAAVLNAGTSTTVSCTDDGAGVLGTCPTFTLDTNQVGL